MSKRIRFVGVVWCVVMLSSLFALAQEETSPLGDAARQARQQKDSKKAATKGPQQPKAPRVITNEEIPEQTRPSAQLSVSNSAYRESSPLPSTVQPSETKAEAVKSQISQAKSHISSLRSQIDNLNGSIHFAPANCASNCVQWNERQLQKQQQIEQMKAQLEDQEKRLEDMQESARQQGFGSSVYDP